MAVAGGLTVITGGGTGIGAGLAHHLASVHSLPVLVLGRRLEPLLKVQSRSPDHIRVLQVDIASDGAVDKIKEEVNKSGLKVKYLVQNAAVGQPDKLVNIKSDHLEYAFRVNVVAPLMLVQGLLEDLKVTKGRVLHLGTSVATRPQLGTATYGITKLAFHRLYEQLNVELADEGVGVGSVRPGMVDTEGLWDHYHLAKQQNLSHTEYFDQAKVDGSIRGVEEVAYFLSFLLLNIDNTEFCKEEWAIGDKEHWPRWKKY